MKRWIVSVLLAIFLSSPAVSGAADDTLDPGKANLFNIPFFKAPIDSSPDSKTAKENKAEEEARADAKIKEKERQDKKVDDAINKAWEVK
jgi:hypothetical protein